MLPVTLNFSSPLSRLRSTTGEAEAGLCAGGGEGSQGHPPGGDSRCEFPFPQISVRRLAPAGKELSHAERRQCLPDCEPGTILDWLREFGRTEVTTALDGKTDGLARPGRAGARGEDGARELGWGYTKNPGRASHRIEESKLGEAQWLTS